MPSIRKNPETLRAVKTVADITRRRLTPADRERQIVEGAVTFFSEHGLDGQLRDLARQLGITHTLLYHYFPTKQALIERVYTEMFEGRWKPEWEALMDDKQLDVETKLTRFYSDYAKVILQPEWVRIFLFSGLSDRYITDRYFALLREKLFPRLVRETRKYRGVVSRSKPTGSELELLLGLHGNIFYMGIRRWVYGQAVHDMQSVVMVDDVEDYIHDKVLAYLLSVSAVLDRKTTIKKV
ncbi:MAG: TetR/AcrR family transcriptional regulator [Polaromonas sp.]